MILINQRIRNESLTQVLFILIIIDIKLIS